MSSWKEISNEQNIKLSNKMLEQQGEINDLKAKLRALEAFTDFLIALDYNLDTRRNITLTEIIARAKKAKAGKLYV